MVVLIFQPNRRRWLCFRMLNLHFIYTVKYHNFPGTWEKSIASCRRKIAGFSLCINCFFDLLTALFDWKVFKFNWWPLVISKSTNLRPRIVPLIYLRNMTPKSRIIISLSLFKIFLAHTFYIQAYFLRHVYFFNSLLSNACLQFLLIYLI